MASKQELAARAKQLSDELDVEINVDGMSHADLTNQVAELEQLKQELEAETQKEDQPPLPRAPQPINGAGDEFDGVPREEPPEPPLRHPWQIAPGCSVTCMRGVLGPGDEARAEYFHPRGKQHLTGNEKTDLAEGQKVLDGLIKSGVVIAGKKAA